MWNKIMSERKVNNFSELIKEKKITGELEISPMPFLICKKFIYNHHIQ